jgi:hypothetical protein
MACCLSWEKKEERRYLDIYCRLRPLCQDMESCVEVKLNFLSKSSDSFFFRSNLILMFRFFQKVNDSTLQIMTPVRGGGYDNRHKFRWDFLSWFLPLKRFLKFWLISFQFFSAVFDEDATQAEVFEAVAVPLIFRFLHGTLVSLSLNSVVDTHSLVGDTWW